MDNKLLHNKHTAALSHVFSPSPTAKATTSALLAGKAVSRMFKNVSVGEKVDIESSISVFVVKPAAKRVIVVTANRDADNFGSTFSNSFAILSRVSAISGSMEEDCSNCGFCFALGLEYELVDGDLVSGARRRRSAGDGEKQEAGHISNGRTARAW